MELASYITGFVDGEGCFTVSFNQRPSLKAKIEVRPSFSVSQNMRNVEIIRRIHKYFDCGSIRFSKRDQNYKFEVRSIADLKSQVIPHFEKYPLQSSKKNDFQIFVQVCDLIYKNQHHQPNVLAGIIDQTYRMNPAGKRKYTKDNLLKLLAR